MGENLQESVMLSSFRMGEGGKGGRREEGSSEPIQNDPCDLVAAAGVHKGSPLA